MVRAPRRGVGERRDVNDCCRHVGVSFLVMCHPRSLFSVDKHLCKPA